MKSKAETLESHLKTSEARCVQLETQIKEGMNPVVSLCRDCDDPLWNQIMPWNGYVDNWHGRRPWRGAGPNFHMDRQQWSKTARKSCSYRRPEVVDIIDSLDETELLRDHFYNGNGMNGNRFNSGPHRGRGRGRGQPRGGVNYFSNSFWRDQHNHNPYNEYDRQGDYSPRGKDFSNYDRENDFSPRDNYDRENDYSPRDNYDRENDYSPRDRSFSKCDREKDYPPGGKDLRDKLSNSKARRRLSSPERERHSSKNHEYDGRENSDRKQNTSSHRKSRRSRSPGRRSRSRTPDKRRRVERESYGVASDTKHPRREDNPYSESQNRSKYYEQDKYNHKNYTRNQRSSRNERNNNKDSRKDSRRSRSSSRNRSRSSSRRRTRSSHRKSRRSRSVSREIKKALHKSGRSRRSSSTSSSESSSSTSTSTSSSITTTQSSKSELYSTSPEKKSRKRTYENDSSETFSKTGLIKKGRQIEKKYKSDKYETDDSEMENRTPPRLGKRTSSTSGRPKQRRNPNTKLMKDPFRWVNPDLIGPNTCIARSELTVENTLYENVSAESLDSGDSSREPDETDQNSAKQNRKNGDQECTKKRGKKDAGKTKEAYLVAFEQEWSEICTNDESESDKTIEEKEEKVNEENLSPEKVDIVSNREFMAKKDNSNMEGEKQDSNVNELSEKPNKSLPIIEEKFDTGEKSNSLQTTCDKKDFPNRELEVNNKDKTIEKKEQKINEDDLFQEKADLVANRELMAKKDNCNLEEEKHDSNMNELSEKHNKSLPITEEKLDNGEKSNSLPTTTCDKKDFSNRELMAKKDNCNLEEQKHELNVNELPENRDKSLPITEETLDNGEKSNSLQTSTCDKKDLFDPFNKSIKKFMQEYAPSSSMLSTLDQWSADMSKKYQNRQTVSNVTVKKTDEPNTKTCVPKIPVSTANTDSSTLLCDGKSNTTLSSQKDSGKKDGNTAAQDTNNTQNDVVKLKDRISKRNRSGSVEQDVKSSKLQCDGKPKTIVSSSMDSRKETGNTATPDVSDDMSKKYKKETVLQKSALGKTVSTVNIDSSKLLCERKSNTTFTSQNDSGKKVGKTATQDTNNTQNDVVILKDRTSKEIKSVKRNISGSAEQDVKSSKLHVHSDGKSNISPMDSGKKITNTVKNTKVNALHSEAEPNTITSELSKTAPTVNTKSSKLQCGRKSNTDLSSPSDSEKKVGDTAAQNTNNTQNDVVKQKDRTSKEMKSGKRNRSGSAEQDVKSSKLQCDGKSKTTASSSIDSRKEKGNTATQDASDGMSKKYKTTAISKTALSSTDSEKKVGDTAAQDTNNTQNDVVKQKDRTSKEMKSDKRNRSGSAEQDFKSFKLQCDGKSKTTASSSIDSRKEKGNTATQDASDGMSKKYKTTAIGKTALSSTDSGKKVSGTATQDTNNTQNDTVRLKDRTSKDTKCDKRNRSESAEQDVKSSKLQCDGKSNTSPIDSGKKVSNTVKNTKVNVRNSEDEPNIKNSDLGKTAPTVERKSITLLSPIDSGKKVGSSATQETSNTQTDVVRLKDRTSSETKAGKRNRSASAGHNIKSFKLQPDGKNVDNTVTQDMHSTHDQLGGNISKKYQEETVSVITVNNSKSTVNKSEDEPNTSKSELGKIVSAAITNSSILQCNGKSNRTLKSSKDSGKKVGNTATQDTNNTQNDVVRLKDRGSSEMKSVKRNRSASAEQVIRSEKEKISRNIWDNNQFIPLGSKHTPKKSFRKESAEKDRPIKCTSSGNDSHMPLKESCVEQSDTEYSLEKQLPKTDENQDKNDDKIENKSENNTKESVTEKVLFKKNKPRVSNGTSKPETLARKEDLKKKFRQDHSPFNKSLKPSSFAKKLEQIHAKKTDSKVTDKRKTGGEHHQTEGLSLKEPVDSSNSSHDEKIENSSAKDVLKATHKNLPAIVPLHHSRKQRYFSGPTETQTNENPATPRRKNKTENCDKNIFERFSEGLNPFQYKEQETICENESDQCIAKETHCVTKADEGLETEMCTPVLGHKSKDIPYEPLPEQEEEPTNILEVHVEEDEEELDEDDIELIDISHSSPDSPVTQSGGSGDQNQAMTKQIVQDGTGKNKVESSNNEFESPFSPALMPMTPASPALRQCAPHIPAVHKIFKERPTEETVVNESDPFENPYSPALMPMTPAPAALRQLAPHIPVVHSLFRPAEEEINTDIEAESPADNNHDTETTTSLLKDQEATIQCEVNHEIENSPLKEQTDKFVKGTDFESNQLIHLRLSGHYRFIDDEIFYQTEDKENVEKKKDKSFTPSKRKAKRFGSRLENASRQLDDDDNNTKQTTPNSQSDTKCLSWLERAKQNIKTKQKPKASSDDHATVTQSTSGENTALIASHNDLVEKEKTDEPKETNHVKVVASDRSAEHENIESDNNTKDSMISPTEELQGTATYSSGFEVCHTKVLHSDKTVETIALLKPKNLYYSSGRCLLCQTCSAYFTPLAYTVHHDDKLILKEMDLEKSKQQKFSFLREEMQLWNWSAETIFDDFVKFFNAEKSRNGTALRLKLPAKPKALDIEDCPHREKETTSEDEPGNSMETGKDVPTVTPPEVEPSAPTELTVAPLEGTVADSTVAPAEATEVHTRLAKTSETTESHARTAATPEETVAHTGKATTPEAHTEEAVVPANAKQLHRSHSRKSTDDQSALQAVDSQEQSESTQIPRKRNTKAKRPHSWQGPNPFPMYQNNGNYQQAAGQQFHPSNINMTSQPYGYHQQPINRSLNNHPEFQQLRHNGNMAGFPQAMRPSDLQSTQVPGNFNQNIPPSLHQVHPHLQQQQPVTSTGYMGTGLSLQPGQALAQAMNPPQPQPMSVPQSFTYSASQSLSGTTVSPVMTSGHAQTVHAPRQPASAEPTTGSYMGNQPMYSALTSPLMHENRSGGPPFPQQNLPQNRHRYQSGPGQCNMQATNIDHFAQEQTVYDRISPIPHTNTVHVPRANTVHVPQTNTVHVPQENTVHVPQTNTVHVPQTNTVHVPQANTVHVPQTNTVHVPQANTVHGPQTNTVHVPHVPQANTVHVPQANTVHVPQANNVHVPQANTVHVPQTNTVHVPQANTIHVPQTNTVHVPQTNTVHVPQANTVHVPQAITVHVPQANTVHVPQSNPIGYTQSSPAATSGITQQPSSTNQSSAQDCGNRLNDLLMQIARMCNIQCTDDGMSLILLSQVIGRRGFELLSPDLKFRLTNRRK